MCENEEMQVDEDPAMTAPPNMHERPPKLNAPSDEHSVFPRRTSRAHVLGLPV
jgi:hypothetical protein